MTGSCPCTTLRGDLLIVIPLIISNSCGIVFGNLSHALRRDATSQPLGRHARAKCPHHTPYAALKENPSIHLESWHLRRQTRSASIFQRALFDDQFGSTVSGQDFYAVENRFRSIPEKMQIGLFLSLNSFQRDDPPSICLRSVRLSLLQSRSPNGRNMYTSTIHRCDGLLQSVLGGLCIFRRVIRHQNLSIFPLLYVTELTPRCDDCHIDGRIVLAWVDGQVPAGSLR